MENILIKQLEQILPEKMTIPGPIAELYKWIESRGYYADVDNGKRCGGLHPEEEVKKSWTETERNGGTIIEFHAEGNSNLKYWFGQENPDVIKRLCVFGNSGAEGSMVAFWLDENNKQKIVHLGSGSGSVMVCVLAEDAVDFLRLLAIGYDEICWNEEYSQAPNIINKEFTVYPNTEFRDWVTTTFNTTIPEKATDIVKYPEVMGQGNPKDEFNIWVEKNTQ